MYMMFMYISLYTYNPFFRNVAKYIVTTTHSFKISYILNLTNLKIRNVDL